MIGVPYIGTCESDGCDWPALAGVKCWLHERGVKHGHRYRPIADRFWEKVAPGENGCWGWSGSMSGEYAQLGVLVPQESGKAKLLSIRGNVVSVAVHTGRWYVPCWLGLGRGAIHVCHTCESKVCTNPRHLYVGNAQTNSTDWANSYRAATAVRLNADRDELVLACRVADYTLQEIGDVLGLTRERVRQLEKRELDLLPSAPVSEIRKQLYAEALGYDPLERLRETFGKESQ